MRAKNEITSCIKNRKPGEICIFKCILRKDEEAKRNQNIATNDGTWFSWGQTNCVRLWWKKKNCRGRRKLLRPKRPFNEHSHFLVLIVWQLWFFVQKYSGPAKRSRGLWIFLHGLLDSNAREARVGVTRERQAKRPLLLACDVLDFIKVLPFSTTWGKSSGVFASRVWDAKSLIQVGPEATILPSVFSRTEWSRRQYWRHCVMFNQREDEFWECLIHFRSTECYYTSKYYEYKYLFLWERFIGFFLDL